MEPKDMSYAEFMDEYAEDIVNYALMDLIKESPAKRNQFAALMRHMQFGLLMKRFELGLPI